MAKKYTKKQREGAKKILKNFDKFIDEFDSITAKDKLKNAKKICKRAIDSYYQNYRPGEYNTSKDRHPYRRHYSLYDAVNLGIRNGNTFIFELGSEFMPKNHRVDKTNPDYIYNRMFIQGWHGGADKGKAGQPPHPNPGELYWKIHPEFIYWWNRPARKMYPLSPYEIIKQRWEKYLKDQYPVIRKKAFMESIEKCL